MSYQLLQGDCVEVLRTLPANSVQCCVTSPPYFGLRSYLDGGHEDKPLEIGTEETPEAYVAKLVEVFREVRRVLRDDGTLWLNLGDSYNGSGGAGGDYAAGGLKEGQPKYPGRRVDGLKPKDLIGIPWMVAFALRADGWWLRSEIIWHKRAPMPESVTDRPTKAHEQVFLLSKQASYFYDATAIMEPNAPGYSEMPSNGEGKRHELKLASERNDFDSTLDRGARRFNGAGRNKRSVWTLGPESYAGAHFATMPTKLVEPCILAGTSAKGCCSVCGAPWERVVEREATLEVGRKQLGYGKSTDAGGFTTNGHGGSTLHHDVTKTTLDWQPTCACNAAVVPCTVLDPFNGSGTTGAVALKHHRNYVGIDLNANYIALAHERIGRSQPTLLEVMP